MLKKSGARGFPIKLRVLCGAESGALVAAAQSVAAAFGIVLLAGQAARAACTPGSPVNGATVTCTGATLNQNAAAGYGTATDAGNTITVEAGASVTSTNGSGLLLATGTVVNHGSITAVGDGVEATTGPLTLTNYGSINSSGDGAIVAFTNTPHTIINFGSIVSSGVFSIRTTGGAQTLVINHGSITHSGFFVAVTAGTFINYGLIDSQSAGVGSRSITNYGVIITRQSHGAITLGSSTGLTTNFGTIAATGAGTNGIVSPGNVLNIGTASGGVAGLHVDGFSAPMQGQSVNSGVLTGGLYGIQAVSDFGLAVDLAVTNSGTISGGDTGLQVRGNLTATNSGSIAGGSYGIRHVAGGVFVNPHLDITNAGTISGSVAAIQFLGGGNTLTLAPGSVINGLVQSTAGGNIFQLGGSGAGTFDVSALGDTAQYRNFGTFNKIDSSVWTLTGTSAFAGDVNVDAGTLIVDGSVAAASAVFVNPGATLGGTGTVAATFIDDGAILAPGTPTSIGTLTVNDTLLFCACSLYSVKVFGLSADKTQVNGAAFLSDAHVVATVTGSSIANRYTILTATGGLTDRFGTLTGAAPAGFTSNLSYDANNVYLNYQFTPILPAGLNRNEQSVASAFKVGVGNIFNAGGAIPVAFGALTPAMLTQMSGEGATGSQQSTFQAMTQFMGVMTDPFTAGRGGDAPGATGFTEGDDAFNAAYAASGRKRAGAERDAYGMITKAVPRAPTFVSRWNVWGAGFGGSQSTDGNVVAGSNMATSRIGGVAVGADYWLSPQTIAGFALAGGGTSFSIANGLGSGRSDLFQAGAFIRHNVGPAYIAAAAAYGWQDISTDRTVTIAGVDRLRAQFNANAFSGRIEGGYRFVTPWMGGIGITPYAAGQSTTFDLPAYAEQVLSGANTFALAYGSRSVSATRSELGFRADKSFALPTAILTLRGRAAWAHDFNPDRAVAATFQTLPGASFVVNGAAQASDSALTTASAELNWFNGWSAAATFEGEFSNVTRSYAGKGVVRYAW
jgi:autotransporter-associated beta strand protein